MAFAHDETKLVPATVLRRARLGLSGAAAAGMERPSSTFAPRHGSPSIAIAKAPRGGSVEQARLAGAAE